MKSKPHLQRLRSSYIKALLLHVRKQPISGPRTPQHLGAKALKLGLTPLELARIHEEALSKLLRDENAKKKHQGIISHACVFFSNALLPIESTREGKAARDSDNHLRVIVEALTTRTLQLSAANEELRIENEHRHSMEATLRASETATARLLKQSREMEEDLRLLSRRILCAQEEERKTISRELHDVIAQNLTGIHVQLEAITSRTGANTNALHKQIKATQHLLETSVNKIHRFARDLRPAMLDDLGLVPTMRSWMKRYSKETGVVASLNAEASVEKLDIHTRTVLFRIAQEAMTNVALHAKASHVRTTIRMRPANVSMSIKDDGHGFKVDDSSFIKQSKRLGLLGMRERAEMVGGTFCVDSSPGQGTTVRTLIPKKAPTKPSGKVRLIGDPATLQCP